MEVDDDRVPLTRLQNQHVVAKFDNNMSRIYGKSARYRFNFSSNLWRLY